MTQEYIKAWVIGAEDALRGLRGLPDANYVDSEYIRGYKEGYRIGKGFRDADG